MVYLTRKAEFSASHYYHNPGLSAEENQRLYGKCNNPNGHGHNYTLEVSVRGPIDAVSGYVIALSVLRAIVERWVVDETDHRNFNMDVEYMQGVIPTSENIVVA